MYKEEKLKYRIIINSVKMNESIQNNTIAVIDNPPSPLHAWSINYEIYNCTFDYNQRVSSIMQDYVYNNQ